jgi:nucleotide-binding universal stress UspA family protein
LLPFRRVLVGWARSGSDDHLVEYAARVAGEAELSFVHVGRLSEPRSAAVLEEMRAQVARLSSGASLLVPPAVHVLHGVRIDLLLAQAVAADADLIMLGQRSVRARRTLARRLAMKAPCSVWMVPGHAPLRVTRVLAAVDFSPSSAAALRAATQLISGVEQTQCLALHVDVEETPERRQPAGRTAELAWQEFTASLDLPPAFRFVAEPGRSAAKTLCDAAVREDADLIVMGARGQSSSAAVLLGREVEEVLRHSRVPVLVVRRPEDRLPLAPLLLAGATPDLLRHAG